VVALERRGPVAITAERRAVARGAPAAIAAGERSHAMKHLVSLGTLVIGVVVAAAPAHAGQKWLRVSGFTDVGLACEATFTRNPAVEWEVTSVKISIFGPYGTIPDPHYWHLDSPTVGMDDQSTGVHRVEYDNGVPVREFHESSTAVHNGPFVAGTWTVSLMNTAGEDCSVYDDQVKVIFSTP
jgi:hypothetical protein